MTAASIRFEPDIIWFQITMDDALPVCLVYRRTDLLHDIDNKSKRQTAFLLEHIAERTAIKVFHNQISDLPLAHLREAEVGDIDDVWMAQATGSLCLALEPLDELHVGHKLRGNHFDSNGAFCA